MPEERSLAGISAAEHAARLGRAEAIARRLGFVGIVEYRHASSRSGGAHYGMAPTIEQDLILVYADAFRRDAAGDDFSLPAIIAHERGHQVLCRNERLRRNTPQEMSSATEEVLASLIGSLISDDPRDGEMLVLKALAELVDRGMPAADASRRVEDILNYLEAIL
jgi:hypothetical protein